MKNSQLLCLLSLATATLLAQTPCENWTQPYSGDDATGAKVIGYWRLDEPLDSSGKGHTPKLSGATIVPDVRFGHCLESFGSSPTNDKRRAAMIANATILSPPAAFTIEMWLKPKKDLPEYSEAFLVDKKYVADTDYQWTLGRPDETGARAMHLRLGFGDSSDTFIAPPAPFIIDRWTHVAVTYDGTGTARFFKDGTLIGSVTKANRGAITPGKHPLSIADRIGSYFHGFPGYIASVRLCNQALEFRPIQAVCETERRAFQRMERDITLNFKVINLQKSAIKGATLKFFLTGELVKEVALPELAANGAHAVALPFDTSLRPDTYALQAQLELAHRPDADPYRSNESHNFTITPRRAPRMPVVMWGVYSSAGTLKELPRLKEIGFTHCLGLGANFDTIYKAGVPTAPDTLESVKQTRELLDTALINDFGIVASLSPGSWAAKALPELRRIDKHGKSNAERPTLCATAPGMDTFCYNVGASVARAYSDYPAWQAALLNTEVRDAANVCWHDHDKAAARQALGYEYSDKTPRKNGANYANIPDFPTDRVVPDDHPMLRFLSWYWKEGDGWNRLNSELNRGLKSGGRKDLWTFHDPAVRVASVYGSGGTVDNISQWTYSYPDPIRIGLATDELFAMARGAAQPQQVMKMTQIIWYRSQTAPMAKGDEVTKARASPWEDTDPDAAFPTIAPMHLREAFWTKIARPIRGIMYHGWQSLVPTDGRSSYRYTHPQTQHELKHLIDEVVTPLGPTLLQIDDPTADVAFLESFASQMFASRGTYGWGRGWQGDAYQILLWASLQPQVIYDETIVAHGLDNFKVLVLTDCDILTATVVAKIKAFQQKGGIVVGDERLCPAITPDIKITSYNRTRKAQEDRAALIAKAHELRAALGQHYRPWCDSSNADIVPRRRVWQGSDYLFAVNDKREFGNYVGQHGLVMEDGLPSETTLKIARTGGYVYDLLLGRQIEAKAEDNTLTLPCHLGPCEGALYLITDSPLKGVQVKTAAEATRGSRVECSVTVVDDAGAPIRAVVPLKVDILDPSGQACEWSGYYGAPDGTLKLTLEIAANDQPGLWQIRAIELAARHTAVAYLRIK